MTSERFYLLDEIDVASSRTVRALLMGLVERQETSELVIDCRNLTYVDASGVGAIVAAKRAMIDSGRACRIEHVTSTAVRRVFDLLGIEYRDDTQAEPLPARRIPHGARRHAAAPRRSGPGPVPRPWVQA